MLETEKSSKPRKLANWPTEDRLVIAREGCCGQDVIG
jgi:hypothetical protein